MSLKSVFLNRYLVLVRLTQKVLHSGDDCELLACALRGQCPFLAVFASEHQPDLTHGGTEDWDAIDRDEMIAGLNTFVAFGHRGFAVEVSDGEDGEASVIFGAKDEADDVEVGEVEHSSDVEIDGGVGVVEADAIVHQGFGTDEAR